MDITQLFRSYDPDRLPPQAAEPYCPRCGAVMAASSGAPRMRCAECGFVRYRNPIPSVIVVVEREGRVLLGRRAAWNILGGTWCLPGGFIEWEEDFLSAGRREVREETGLVVRIDRILNVVTNHLSPALHVLAVVLLASVVSGAERPGDDIVELGWFAPGGPLPEMAFEADAVGLRRFAEMRAGGSSFGDADGLLVDPRRSGAAGEGNR